LLINNNNNNRTKILDFNVIHPDSWSFGKRATTFEKNNVVNVVVFGVGVVADV
jgi:hypothetical protein